MPDGFLRALIDPTAPLPDGWPSGALGAFLLFLVPIGGGIPVGVLMARDAGVSPPVTALFYFVSDLIMAVAVEPLLLLLVALGRLVPVLGRLGQRLISLTRQTGLRDGAHGPLGLIMVSFTVDPMTGRAAAKAAGHGFVPGWSLAIAGDMLYFGLLMVSTLWLSGVLGDERLTVGAVFLIMLFLPRLLRRIRRPAAAPAPVPALVAAPAGPPAPISRAVERAVEGPVRPARRRRRSGRRH